MKKAKTQSEFDPRSIRMEGLASVARRFMAIGRKIEKRYPSEAAELIGAASALETIATLHDGFKP